MPKRCNSLFIGKQRDNEKILPSLCLLKMANALVPFLFACLGFFCYFNSLFFSLLQESEECPQTVYEQKSHISSMGTDRK